MDVSALLLSLRLGGATLVVLVPLGIAIGRTLAVRTFRGKAVIESLITLPLVLPPTVLGFYLLGAFSPRGWLGGVFLQTTGSTLAFSFEGLLLASLIINLPLAAQPIQRAFEGIAPELRDAAACCGMTPLRTLMAVELPLAWPGILTGAVLAFAHTLGEFGVVLMVGGNIPGETRTLSIAIYDRLQAFDEHGARVMAATLLCVAIAAAALARLVSGQIGRRRHS
jgi:molybdate transport system permease protein